MADPLTPTQGQEKHRLRDPHPYSEVPGTERPFTMESTTSCGKPPPSQWRGIWATAPVGLSLCLMPCQLEHHRVPLYPKALALPPVWSSEPSFSTPLSWPLSSLVFLSIPAELHKLKKWISFKDLWKCETCCKFPRFGVSRGLGGTAVGHCWLVFPSLSSWPRRKPLEYSRVAVPCRPNCLFSKTLKGRSQKLNVIFSGFEQTDDRKMLESSNSYFICFKLDVV